MVTKILLMHLSPSLPPRVTSERRCCPSDVLPITQSNLKSCLSSTFLTESPLWLGVHWSIHKPTLPHPFKSVSVLLTLFLDSQFSNVVVINIPWGAREAATATFSATPLSMEFLRASVYSIKGTGTTGSATYHGLCPASRVQGAAPRKVLEDVGLVPRSHSCRHCQHLQVVMWAWSWLPCHDPQGGICTRPLSGCLYAPESTVQGGLPESEGGGGSGVGL